ncbi:MAG: hypothetical protein IAG13_15545, partial [Deltaproteobacteria bacterium]|nr:hypothetical protein [Nannocystaceae bacterium]
AARAGSAAEYFRVLAADAPSPTGSACEVVRGLEVFLPLEGLVDLRAERSRLGKELDKQHKEIESLARKLDNAGFVAKAPPEVVEGERVRLGELRTNADKLAKTIAQIDAAG